MYFSKLSVYMRGEECRWVIKFLVDENDVNVNLYVVDIIFFLYILKVKCGLEDVFWKCLRKI